MSYGFLDIARTPDVQAAQAAMGSAALWQDFAGHRRFDRFTAQEAAFIGERDSFYIATVSQTGWPYIQHRGGPRGFLKLLDEQTLAFADYRGNRQYISVGNLAGNARVCLFLMDYPRRRRMKLYAEAEVLAEADEPALAELTRALDNRRKVERIVRLHLQAFDWNCPQHITPRFSEQELAPAWAQLQRQLAALQAENAELRQQLDGTGRR